MTSSYQNVRLFIGFDKFTYFSGGSGMEVGTSNIDLLRLKCVFLNSPILVLNIILHMFYILTLYIYITYLSYLLDHVIV